MRAFLTALAASLAMVAQPLAAALPVGAKAPDIRTMGALAESLSGCTSPSS